MDVTTSGWSHCRIKEAKVPTTRRVKLRGGTRLSPVLWTPWSPDLTNVGGLQQTLCTKRSTFVPGVAGHEPGKTHI